MFHQANIIPAGDVGGDPGLSLLDYWYERVMQEFSKWVTFPVKVRLVGSPVGVEWIICRNVDIYL